MNKQKKNHDCDIDYTSLVSHANPIETSRVQATTAPADLVNALASRIRSPDRASPAVPSVSTSSSRAALRSAVLSALWASGDPEISLSLYLSI